jgi:hypothetical protein
MVPQRSLNVSIERRHRIEKARPLIFEVNDVGGGRHSIASEL